MTEDNGLLTRRRVLRSAGAIAGASTVGGAALWYGSQPALAIETDDISSDGITVESNDGSVEEVWLEPDVLIDWDNFHDDGIESFDIDIEVEIGGNSTVENIEGIVEDAEDNDDVTNITEEESDDDGSFEGSDNAVIIQLDEISLIEDGGLSSSDFPEDVEAGDEDTESMTVDITVTPDPVNEVDSDDTEGNVDGNVEITVNNPDNVVESGAEIDGDGE